MKQITVVFKAGLLIMVFASLAACSGGIFIDPGYGGAGTGNYDRSDYSDGGNGSTGGGGGSIGGGGGSGSTGGGGGSESKPAILDNNASYQEAVDKLDEIIEYCEAHPGNQNNSVKSSVETMKGNFSVLNVSSNWNTVALVNISAINAYILLLQ
ncbi:MAG: hypothetical protein LBH26_08990 [Treponema sp.]|jgi:hypothetical protein|nr:hypothetical protein [Treponema sp.]